MDITQVERRRSELLHFVLLIIIALMITVVFVSILDDSGPLIPSLGILSLLACLYAIGKERGLKTMQSQLVEELLMKDRQVAQLGREFKETRHQLQDEKTQKGEVEGRLREVSSLYRALSMVNVAHDVQRTPTQVLRAALELIGANCGSVMLLDASKQRLTIVAAQGLDKAVLAQPARPVTEGIAGWVAQNGEPVLLTEELANDERFKDLLHHPMDYLSAMSVPLQVRGQVIGVLNFRISDEGEKRQFSEHDLRIAALFAQHASVAIDNSRLMMALQQLQVAYKNGGAQSHDAPVGQAKPA
jgi:transcriptional regulator with GAF, ATPase, and Fis domain